MSEIIWTKLLDESTQVEIARTQAGYAVAVRDLDADEVLPFVRIFDDFESAKAHALKGEQPC